jgi:natural product precursor
MKTVNFKSFAEDKIQEKELNFLKGGAHGDPLSDILIPPTR